MLRNLLKTNASRSPVFLSNRSWSVQTNTASDESAVDPEWANALPYEKIPRPGFWRMIKEFAPGGRYRNAPLSVVHRGMRESYGDLMVFPGSLGRNDVVLSFNPEDFQKVLRTEGLWPRRGAFDTFAYYRKHVRPDVFKGVGGLISEQNQGWHDFRTIVNPVMLQPKTVKLYVDKIDAVTREFMDVISNMRDHKNELPADFDQWMNRWSLESIGILALDTRMGVLERNLSSESANFIKNIREFFQLSFELDIQPSIWKYYKTPKFIRLMKVLDELTSVVGSKVDEAITRMEKSSSATNDNPSVLEKLLKIDRQVAIVMAYDMLLAGVDTTSTASTGVLYCLAMNPEKQARLREELRTILPTKNSPLTPENMRNLPYLRACIKEGLRLYPPTSGNFRATGKDLVLQGYRVPKGTDVAMAAMILHQKDEFFPRGKEFLPERWLKEETGCPSGRDVHPFVLLPFGFGPRSCIGKRMALLEIEILVARITRQFEFRWNYEELKFAASLINVPVNELKFEMVDIDD